MIKKLHEDGGGAIGSSGPPMNNSGGGGVAGLDKNPPGPSNILMRLKRKSSANVGLKTETLKGPTPIEPNKSEKKPVTTYKSPLDKVRKTVTKYRSAVPVKKSQTYVSKPVPPEQRPMVQEEKKSSSNTLKKTLYVSRPLLNADAIIAWAKKEGFTRTLGAKDFHVTIAFSREKVDWSKLSPEENKLIISGGERGLHSFTNNRNSSKKDIVLTFESKQLTSRWYALKKAGAHWDHQGYQPHVTITYAADPEFDFSKIKPYTGPLEFGGEKFSEVVEKWDEKIKEVNR